MKQYLKENENKLIEYCVKNGLSFEKIKKCPRCYTNDTMFIQYFDSSKVGQGLKNNEPAKVLLTIKRTTDGIEFEPSEDIDKYLA